MPPHLSQSSSFSDVFGERLRAVELVEVLLRAAGLYGALEDSVDEPLPLEAREEATVLALIVVNGIRVKVAVIALRHLPYLEAFGDQMLDFVTPIAGSSRGYRHPLLADEHLHFLLARLLDEELERGPDFDVHELAVAARVLLNHQAGLF